MRPQPLCDSRPDRERTRRGQVVLPPSEPSPVVPSRRGATSRGRTDARGRVDRLPSPPCRPRPEQNRHATARKAACGRARRRGASALPMAAREPLRAAQRHLRRGYAELSVPCAKISARESHGTHASLADQLSRRRKRSGIENAESGPDCTPNRSHQPITLLGSDQMDATSSVPKSGDIRRRRRPRNLPRRAQRAFRIADRLGIPRLPETRRA